MKSIAFHLNCLVQGGAERIVSNLANQFAKEGIKIIYFPYTKGVSSTKITNALKQVRGWTSEASEAAAKTHINGGGGND